MSFERHATVAPFLAVYENGHSGFENKEQLFEKIARTLHEELVKYQEQEAISNSKTVAQLVDCTKSKLLDNIYHSLDRGDLASADTLSLILQRVFL